MAYHVGSEVGRLRQVILHRPGDEMTRLTPTNKDDLLFDDVLWLHRAQAEHDEFAHTLSSRGAEVLYLTERASFRLTPEGVELFEIAPGIDLQRDVLDQMAFAPRVAQPLATMAPAHFQASA